MHDAIQEILHGIPGQRLVFDAPEGRASAVSVTVVEAGEDDDAPAELALAGAAVVDPAPNTTLAAPAGASQQDPNALLVDDATGIVRGRPYLLTSTAGVRELVEIVAILGADASTRQPLVNDYPAGSTLQTTRLSVALDAAWIANRANLSNEASIEPRYRAIWVYEVDGATYRGRSGFDLVRYSSAHHVTPLHVDTRFPGWIDDLPVDYRREQGRPLIAQAWRAVRMDLRGDGKLGRWLRNSDVVGELVICRANLLAIEDGALRGVKTRDQLVAAQLIYRQRYEQLVREPHTTLATSPGGAERPVSAARRAPLFRR